MVPGSGEVGFSPERGTDLPNFISVKYKKPWDIDSRELGNAEIGWQETQGGLKIQTFIDVLGSVKPNPKRRVLVKAPPIFGGEAAAVIGGDLTHLCRLAFPRSADPTAKALRVLTGDFLKGDKKRDVISVLSDASASAVLTGKGDVPGAAYVTISTRWSLALWRLYEPTKLDAIRYKAARSADIPGWQSAYVFPAKREFPREEDFADLDIVVAYKRGTVLVGIGHLEDFGVESPASPEIKRAFSEPGIINALITSKLSCVKGMKITSVLAEDILKHLEYSLAAYGIYCSASDVADIVSIGSVTAREAFNGRGYIDITRR
jgi:hypothetical protein